VFNHLRLYTVNNAGKLQYLAGQTGDVNVPTVVDGTGAQVGFAARMAFSTCARVTRSCASSCRLSSYQKGALPSLWAIEQGRGR
jgi:hypothetical protein